MNSMREVIADGSIAIVGPHIAAVGKRKALERQWSADQHLDGKSFVVVAGMVNAIHTRASCGTGPGKGSPRHRSVTNCPPSGWDLPGDQKLETPADPRRFKPASEPAFGGA